MINFRSNLKSTLFYIVKNKGYAIFYILGTALAFVFITILIQMYFSLVYNVEPYVFANRIIVIKEFENKEGNKIGGIHHAELNLFTKTLKDVEDIAIYNTQTGNVFIENQSFLNLVNFVNASYWKINKFTFLHGRPFTEKECEDQKTVCVIKKSIANNYFGKTDVIGRSITFQNIEYEIVGVIDDFCGIYTGEISNICVPHIFNKFLSDKRQYYTMNILFKENISENEMKSNVINSIQEYFKNKNIDAYIKKDDLHTLKEYKIKSLGINKTLLIGGTVFLLLILLLIPIINIITLNIANTENRSSEVAIRRALGSNRFSVFSYLMLENILLSLTGLFLGILLVYPTITLLEELFLNFPIFGKVTILNEVNPIVIIVFLIPLNFLFAFMAGCIPAYRVSNRNLAHSLKGGSR